MSWLKTKSLFALSLVAWVTLALVSLREYWLARTGVCYFQTSWLTCAKTISPGLAVFLTAVVAVLFIILTISAWFHFDFFSTTEHKQNHRQWLVIAALLTSALITVPFGSSDVTYYYSAGQAVNQGVNPFTTPWSRSRLFDATITQADTIAGFSYGPLAADLFAVIAHTNSIVWFVVVWKVLMLVALLVTVWLIARLGNFSYQRLLLLFALQPLILFEWLSNGHFDVLWLVTVLGAWWLVRREQWWLAAPLLAVGAWLKFIPLLLAPFFILQWWQATNRDTWKKTIPQLLIGIFLAGGVTYFSWRSFWVGPVTIQPIIMQSKWAVMSLFSTIYYSLQSLFVWLFGNQAHWYLTRLVAALLLSTAIFILYPIVKKIFGLLRKKTTWSEADFFQAMFVTLTVYLLVWQKSLWPWYVTWLLPLAILGRSLKTQTAIRYLLAVPLLFYPVWYTYWRATEQDAVPLLWFSWFISVVITVFPLYVLLPEGKIKKVLAFAGRQIYRVVIIWPYLALISSKQFFVRSKTGGEGTVFVVTSVIHFAPAALSYATTRSVYKPEERVQQTLATIASIRRFYPGAKIALVEAGQKDVMSDFKTAVDHYIYVGDKPAVRRACDSQLKSFGEIRLLLAAIPYLPPAAQYFKMSGRYLLNEQFNPNDWQKGEIVVHYIRPEYLSTRLYAFKQSQFTAWHTALQKSLPFALLDYPIEHTLAKFFPAKRVVTLATIGVSGTDATAGTNVKE